MATTVIGLLHVCSFTKLGAAIVCQMALQAGAQDEEKSMGSGLAIKQIPNCIHPWQDPCESNFPAGCTTSPRAATGAKPLTSLEKIRLPFIAGLNGLRFQRISMRRTELPPIAQPISSWQRGMRESASPIVSRATAVS